MAQIDNRQMVELLSTYFVRREEGGKGIMFHPLTTPLASANWAGSTHSSTGWTKIDLSTVFGAPENIRAVLVRLTVRDSASSTTNGLHMGLGGDGINTALFARPTGQPNNQLADAHGICPCDENGDIYYWCNASGNKTLGAWLYIYGYWL